MSDNMDRSSVPGQAAGSGAARPASIFNAGATPSPEVLLRIATFVTEGGLIDIGGMSALGAGGPGGVGLALC